MSVICIVATTCEGRQYCTHAREHEPVDTGKGLLCGPEVQENPRMCRVYGDLVGCTPVKSESPEIANYKRVRL